jgi:hypothetical protein
VANAGVWDGRYSSILLSADASERVGIEGEYRSRPSLSNASLTFFPLALSWRRPHEQQKAAYWLPPAKVLNWPWRTTSTMG